LALEKQEKYKYKSKSKFRSKLTVSQLADLKKLKKELDIKVEEESHPQEV